MTLDGAKKTLLHITEVSSGGVLPIIANISNGLSDRYNIVVAYGIRFDTPENIEEQFNKKVRLIAVKNFTRELSAKKDLAAMHELNQIVREVKPDVIHMHSSKAGLVGRVGLIFHKAEKYYTPHGYSFLNQAESPLKRKMYYWAEKILAHTGCTTIACGNRELELSRKICRKAQMVRNGIDTDHIDHVLEKASEKTHPYTVYTAGKIWEQKNPQLFEQIAGLCPDIHFIWIGESEENCQIPEGKNIRITGLVDRDQVIRIAKNCDCYISCSLWEGLPVALLEAMYLEKPCVVSDVSGNNELIIDGVTGWLAHSAEEFAVKIQTLSRTNDQNGKARELVEREYSLKRMCESYAEIYG